MATSFYGNIQEAELKNKVAADWFATYDSTPVIGNIDFAVAVPTHGPQLFETEYLLWAEAKKGTSYDIMESFIQLILTIGKARTYEDKLPPAFLGAFDAEKIAFVPYHEVMDVFSQNDFNWNVTPSDHQSKEFQQLLGLLSSLMKKQLVLFRYATDEKELRQFIKRNFRMGQDGVKQIQVTINNFTHIYRKWCAEVKPTINGDWDKLKEAGIIDADFYLADLLSANNTTLKEKLFVLLKSDHYVLDRRVNDTGLENYTQAIPRQPECAHSILEPIQASTSSQILGQDGGTPRLARATGRKGAQRLILHSSAVGGAIAGIPRKRTWRELAGGILYLGLLCWHG